MSKPFPSSALRVASATLRTKSSVFTETLYSVLPATKAAPATMSPKSTYPKEAATRSKPVRVTVDLEPTDYEALREWAYTEKTSHSAVLRALIQLLSRSETLSQQVRRAVSR